jgi:LmbE family N-acetylglucosaminyl deacetylase
MKLVIFEPHPDDLLFGPGPILLEWIKEGKHDIHVITVTDGRAVYRSGEDKIADDVATMTEDDVADMRIKEAKESIEFLEFNQRTTIFSNSMMVMVRNMWRRESKKLYL